MSFKLRSTCLHSEHYSLNHLLGPYCYYFLFNTASLCSFRLASNSLQSPCLSLLRDVIKGVHGHSHIIILTGGILPLYLLTNYFCELLILNINLTYLYLSKYSL